MRVPHTLVLLFGMIVFAFVLTLVLPQGSFERVENDDGRMQVVANSYTPAAEPQPFHWLRLLSVFMVVPRGFAAAQDIIFFVFLTGGTFGVLRATGAVDAMIGRMLPTLGKTPQLLIGGGMLTFAAGASTIGMAEEYIPFVPILLALAIGLGYDAVTAIGILCVGYGVGYGAAAINPFTVLIAQSVAGVELASDIGLRVAIMAIFLAIGYHHVWRYAKRIKEDPSESLVSDIEPDPAYRRTERPELSSAHVAILVATVAGIGVLVWGLTLKHWYIQEMGALFLGLTILLAILGRVSPDKTAQEFCSGAAELTTTALLIGFARSILLVLEDGGVIDTIVHGIAQPLTSVGPAVAAVGMFLVQSVCNLFIPSGSGQAYVTMPIMAPLADLVGVKREISVLAFQFGDGFTNILVPTNAVLVGILAMARIPYDRWLRFILPFMVKIWVVGSLILAVAVWTGAA